MSDLRILALPAVIVLAAACIPRDEPAATTTESGRDACGAAALQDLVGTPAADHRFGSPPQVVRIIPPGLSVTMDFIPGRLNVEIDEAGLITRIYCG